MKRNGWAIASLTAGILALVAHPGYAETIVTGEPQVMGEATVQSYVVFDEQGYPTEIGLTFPATVLSDLPTEYTEYMISLPTAGFMTPFTHIGLNWHPHGHDPDPIYGVPHLDAHFFTISPQKREQITLVGDNVNHVYHPPSSGFAPAGYIMAPDSGVPHEGSHWIDPTSSEFQGQPHGFDHTLIYGFYAGELAFIEPMVSHAALESRQTFTAPVQLPDRYALGRFYPTQYSVSYNAETQQYQISLHHLTFQSSIPTPQTVRLEP